MSENFDTLLLSHIIKKFQDGKTTVSFNEMEKYIRKFPKDIIAKYNFGLMAEKLNKFDIAIFNYKKVIRNKKDHWQSKNNLYLIYFKQKKYTEALKLINQVLILKKNFQPVLRDKAHVLFYINKLDIALTLINESIKLNPLDYIALNILGMIYVGMREYKNAKEVYLRAIKINDQYHPSYSNLAKCLTELNEREDAIKYLNKCLLIKPDFLEGINNLANIYSNIGNFEKAISLYLKILKTDRNHFQINLNIAIAFFMGKDIIQAERYFKIAESINKNDDKLKKNYGLFLLYVQNYKKAWEVGDGRLKLQDFYFSESWISKIKDKLWNGEKIKKNSKILIIKEQGVGDEILYSTIYPDLINNFSNIKIETEKRLIELFKKNFPNKDVFIPFQSISTNRKKIKEFDYVIMAGSLGRLFRNSIHDFPKINFLKSGVDIRKDISNRLLKISNKKKIGISWKSKREFYGEGKSLDLDAMSPLLNNKNFDFINLQYGDSEKEILDFKKKHNVQIHTIPNLDLFNDFEEITALLQNLELFISISNSTTHVAGAANVDTWLIKPKSYALFHYWNQPKNTTPWYPSIKLYDQYENPTKLMKILNDNINKKFKIKD